MQNQSDFSKAFFNKMRGICERQIVNTTEKIVTNEQQRIAHLEKLADDAGKTLAFLQSRVDTLTAERDQLIQKNTALVAENDINLHGAARELNTSWMMHKTMLGAQAALHCLIHGDIRGARDWLEGTTDEAFAEIPDDMTPADLQNWFDKNMTSSDGNNGFLTYEEALNKLRQRSPATSSGIAAIMAEGVDLAIERLHKKFQGTGFIGVPVMALESLAAQLREGAQK